MYSRSQYLATLKNLIDFKREPPTIDEFLDSKYYMGGRLNVYPYWRKKLRELFPDNITTLSTYVVFTGAIGGGKSYVSQIIALYDITKFLCIRDPKKYLDADALQGYAFKFFNVYKWKADLFVDTLIKFIWESDIPFFKRELEDPHSKIHEIRLNSAGRPNDMISEDVIFAHMSELNFIGDVRGTELINGVISRWQSRFQKAENLFSHIILDSSVTETDSPVESFILRSPHARKAVITRLAIWDPKEGLGQYFNYGSFEVYAGDSQRPPFIMTKLDDRTELDQEQILKVPMELRNEFEADIVLALREKAGRSTTSGDTFFTDQERLHAAFNLPKEHDDVVRVDFFDPTDTLYDKLRADIQKLPKERKLFIRIDCGVASDLFGFGIGYGDGVETSWKGDTMIERLKIKIPILIGISRPAGQETPINKVEDLIVQLNNEFDVSLVTTDQYQSTQLRQTCQQHGIKASLMSVDRTDDAYVKTKMFIYQGLVDICDNARAEHEARTLVRVGPRKIDHPATSSKDQMDVVAGLIQSMTLLPLEEVLEPPAEAIQADLESYYDSMEKFHNSQYWNYRSRQ